MWFQELMGFREQNPEQVRENITVVGQSMTSKVNGRTFGCGRLETPTLSELRQRVQSSPLPQQGRLNTSEVVANVQHLHGSEPNALFQVASQFNLLEMVAPSVTPEEGVDIYEQDHTQGPVCAIAAGAGTIYRNYFAPVNEQIGQSAENQIDCLADLGIALGNENSRLWEMRNGYALASESGLREISRKLSAATESERDMLRRTLRIGLHWDVDVTLEGINHAVSQAYCSALPVAYCSFPNFLWAEFAQLVLEASYEATFWAAALNLAQGRSNKLFLTLLGGGAFGNREDWIFSAIKRSQRLFQNIELEVAIVSYGRSNPGVQELTRI
ncbi:hypothetical protein ACFL27_20110 [candidate division CSSED10-310 bacterium]|uniref:Uncharacterized protein n=1 Tax=candidate division CSSED10-310 bacterium TaxID=2855610 RepID=A0ABV6Z233_UNCC1